MSFNINNFIDSKTLPGRFFLSPQDAFLLPGCYGVMNTNSSKDFSMLLSTIILYNFLR